LDTSTECIIDECVMKEVFRYSSGGKLLCGLNIKLHY
jgi:hypothetical protein